MRGGEGKVRKKTRFLRRNHRNSRHGHTRDAAGVKQAAARAQCTFTCSVSLHIACLCGSHRVAYRLTRSTWRTTAGSKAARARRRSGAPASWLCSHTCVADVCAAAAVSAPQSWRGRGRKQKVRRKTRFLRRNHKNSRHEHTRDAAGMQQAAVHVQCTCACSVSLHIACLCESHRVAYRLSRST
jgi:hypothetical protein